jgi:hypothetical protein
VPSVSIFDSGLICADSVFVLSNSELKTEFVKIIAAFQFKIQNLELQHKEEKQKLELTIESMRQKFRAVQHLAAGAPPSAAGSAVGPSPIYGMNMPPMASTATTSSFGTSSTSGPLPMLGVDSRPRNFTVSGPAPPMLNREVPAAAPANLRTLPALPQPLSDQVRYVTTGNRTTVPFAHIFNAILFPCFIGHMNRGLVVYKCKKRTLPLLTQDRHHH